ncbi:proteasome subunit beta, partial [Candidatus Bathyarchaeota archaeon]|nr:proteasome subunit beta [Candidatus Bathyarchaeota archaeon]
PFGSAIEDDMIATGSGSPVAYGVLESGYHSGMSLDEGVVLAVRAINAAIKRNVYTGDAFDVATITRERGYVELTDEEKKKIFSKISA